MESRTCIVQNCSGVSPQKRTGEGIINEESGKLDQAFKNYLKELTKMLTKSVNHA